jgi:hypothetical protein
MNQIIEKQGFIALVVAENQLLTDAPVVVVLVRYWE